MTAIHTLALASCLLLFLCAVHCLPTSRDNWSDTHPHAETKNPSHSVARQGIWLDKTRTPQAPVYLPVRDHNYKNLPFPFNRLYFMNGPWLIKKGKEFVKQTLEDNIDQSNFFDKESIPLLDNLLN